MQLDVDKITESTASRATARIAAVLLFPLVGIIGWFAIDMLTEIKNTQKAFWGQIAKQNETFSDVKSALAKIDTGVSIAAVKSESHFKDDEHFESTTEKALADHDIRLRFIERSVPAAAPAPASPKP